MKQSDFGLWVGSESSSTTPEAAPLPGSFLPAASVSSGRPHDFSATSSLLVLRRVCGTSVPSHTLYRHIPLENPLKSFIGHLPYLA